MSTNLYDTVLVRYQLTGYQTYQKLTLSDITNLSDTVLIRYWTCRILNFSDNELIRQWTDRTIKLLLHIIPTWVADLSLDQKGWIHSLRLGGRNGYQLWHRALYTVSWRIWIFNCTQFVLVFQNYLWFIFKLRFVNKM